MILVGRMCCDIYINDNYVMLLTKKKKGRIFEHSFVWIFLFFVLLLNPVFQKIVDILNGHYLKAERERERERETN